MPRWFQYIGRLEGVSFLVLLLLAMPLKYVAHWPVLVQIMGPVHGALFLAYCAAVFMLGANADWSAKKQGLALIAAVLPGGTFVFERKYLSA
jgi:integral membrane protein